MARAMAKSDRRRRTPRSIPRHVRRRAAPDLRLFPGPVPSGVATGPGRRCIPAGPRDSPSRSRSCPPRLVPEGVVPPAGEDVHAVRTPRDGGRRGRQLAPEVLLTAPLAPVPGAVPQVAVLPPVEDVDPVGAPGGGSRSVGEPAPKVLVVAPVAPAPERVPRLAVRATDEAIEALMPPGRRARFSSHTLVPLCSVSARDLMRVTP
jgi:hypothetical protein